MSAITAAVSKARSFLAFIGILSVLGFDWTTLTRIVVGLSLAVAVAMEASADGHSIWPSRLKRSRYGTAA
ncbi:hypothetical protein ACIGFK_13205 [Streptomyces sp. NPDC085524]|uniref:hypothetical protein n=1 Tax=Streptomyces sp. NPDC085524 TaxID=3365728 RepID=UPI0037D626B4